MVRLEIASREQLNIILGSQSPRRKELLTQAGLAFSTLVKDVKEVYPEELPAEQVPAFLSHHKARAYEKEAETALVITADTVVIFKKKVVGKPENLVEACRMLQLLSGQQHTVVSGITLLYAGRYRTFSEKTEVYFRKLNDTEIEHYVSNFQPLDKAGAYGIQDWIGLIGIARIEGDYYNVMGLPICRLLIELRDFYYRVMRNENTLAVFN